MVGAIDTVNTALASAQTQSKSKTTVDYEAFLTLLVTQLKNQDPTEPMKSTEYMAQLASFSNVEQSVQIKQQLNDLLQANYIDQGSMLIGKTVATPDGASAGIVEEVQIIEGGIVATLNTGQQVQIGDGIRISDTVITPTQASSGADNESS